MKRIVKWLLCLVVPAACFMPAWAGPSCTLNPNNQTVTICAPLNGATGLISPVHVNAGTTDTHAIVTMWIYVDGVRVFFANNVNFIDTNITMQPGTHRLGVPAKDSTGRIFRSVETITVGGSPRVMVSPASATVQEGATQQFTANVAVTWSASCGSISTSGLYTAPNQPGPCTVTATDSSNNKGTASVNVVATTVTVSPNTATLQEGAKQQFTANVAVNWSASCGAIDATGLYTAPNQTGPCTVTATDSLNHKGTALVTVVAATVTVSPSAATLQEGAKQQFTANIAVTWSASCGAIDATGLYTAPNQTGSCTVTATDSSNNKGTASVTVVSKGGVPSSKHVVIIVEENHTAGSVYPNGMPYLASLANAGAYTLQTSVLTAGSLDAGYLPLWSGSTETAFGCNGSNCSTPITDDNIERQLIANGLTWKVYAQSLPSNCYLGDPNNGAGPYVKRHNPAPWYSDTLNSPAQQCNIVTYDQWTADLNSGNLPNYSFIVPDLCNDAYVNPTTCPSGANPLTQADNFLQQTVGPLLSSKYFAAGGDGLLIVTFDEPSNGSNCCVITTFSGNAVKAGTVISAANSHCTILRTEIELLGMNDFPGCSSSAADVFAAAFATGASTTVAVSPRSVTLQGNAQQQFTANVPVTWSASCGAIGTTGLYTAPSQPGACTVTATDSANNVGNASVTVAVASN